MAVATGDLNAAVLALEVGINSILNASLQNYHNSQIPGTERKLQDAIKYCLHLSSTKTTTHVYSYNRDLIA